MFVHSGAGLHGHEFSSSQTTSQRAKHPLLQSSMRRSVAVAESRRFSSPLAPTTQMKVPLDLDSNHNRRTSLPLNQRSVSEYIRNRDHAVRFHDELQFSENSTPVQSEDEESIAGSDFTTATNTSSNKKKRRQRAPRNSTRFALALPPPQLRTKQRMLVQLRPRLLLQLQELGQKRTLPAFDVVPSSHLAGTLILPALRKRCPRLFRSNPDLGPNDLVIVRSEDFTSSTAKSGKDEEENRIDQREVLAIISPVSQDGSPSAEIVFADGSIWTIRPLRNKSYEVVLADGSAQPVTARWARKPQPKRRTSSASADMASGTVAAEPKWTFSIMDPSARRHPIMGILTNEMLEVYDNYTTLSASSGRYPPTRSFAPEMSAQDSAEAGARPRTTIPVNEKHKILMMVSSVWINLSEQGWPASMSPRLSRALHRYSGSESLPRSQTFSGSHRRTSSDSPADKSERSSLEQRSDTSTRGPGSTVPTRSASTAANFFRRKRQSEISAYEFRQNFDAEEPSKKKPTSKLARLIRACLGGLNQKTKS
ncbi:hypothetical protein VHEMI00452 [[Torrubiella] hemipterigena]|uniref:Uncharacterized protein n=1 Tax=[Torrubiella] hemipterigena TaxID=1531966 RepID=A0A0A1SQG4_9HYPO|nr:hypothetical protein VHEMI00452 [[Torrubiella] hemipterigena]